MKFTLLLAAGSALLASAYPLDMEHVIAKRQVNTAQLRTGGTRRLTARQAGVSATPSILTSEYINCDAAFPGFRLTNENAIRFAATSSTMTNSVQCQYNDNSNSGYTCLYDGDSGELNQPVVSLCSLQLTKATSSGTFCYQSCPRRLAAGGWFSSSNVNAASGNSVTNCAYAATQADAFAGSANQICQYDSATGNFIQGSGAGCPATISLSAFCIANVPVA